MRIGLLIADYRKRNSMSMEAFANKCHLSKAYIGMLEQGIHPKTKKPIHPSIDTIKKIADGIGTDFETLFKNLDEDVVLNKRPYEDPEEEELLTLFQNASKEIRTAALAVLKAGQQPPDN